MNYSTLMVHLQLGRSNTGVLQIAADLAQRLKAGVIGIAACQPMMMFYGDGFVSGDVYDQDRKVLDTEMKQAEAELFLLSEIDVSVEIALIGRQLIC